MFQWLFAKYYDSFLKEAEEKGLREWRNESLQNISAGCHFSRDTETVIKNSGFNITEINRQNMRSMPLVVQPSIRDVARKVSDAL